VIVLVVLLAAIGFLLLTLLWGWLEESHGWKGPVCGCAGLLMLAMAAFEVEFPTSGLSPTNLVDPSNGEEDPELEAALMRALLDKRSGSSVTSPSNPQDDVAEVQLRDFPELEALLRSVPGWDLIVFIGPMETGKWAAEDPLITSWWLRRRIAASWNPRSEAFSSMMFVVRDDAVVGTLIARLVMWPTSDWKSVIARTP